MAKAIKISDKTNTIIDALKISDPSLKSYNDVILKLLKNTKLTDKEKKLISEKLKEMKEKEIAIIEGDYDLNKLVEKDDNQ